MSGINSNFDWSIKTEKCLTGNLSAKLITIMKFCFRVCELAFQEGKVGREGRERKGGRGREGEEGRERKGGRGREGEEGREMKRKVGRERDIVGDGEIIEGNKVNLCM